MLPPAATVATKQLTAGCGCPKHKLFCLCLAQITKKEDRPFGLSSFERVKELPKHPGFWYNKGNGGVVMEQWKKDARKEILIVDLEALVPQDHLLRKIEKVMVVSRKFRKLVCRLWSE